MRDVAQALTWLKASFLWVRMRASPTLHGLPPGATAADADAAGTSLLLSTCRALGASRCVATDADAFGLSPLPPGTAMIRDHVRFGTMQRAAAAPAHLSLPDALLLLCSADEFGTVVLRREDKAVLKPLQPVVRYPLMDPATNKQLKARAAGRSLAANGLWSRTALTDWMMCDVCVSP